MLYKKTFYETLELSFPNFMKKDKKHRLTFYEPVLSKKTSLTLVRKPEVTQFFDLVLCTDLIWASIPSETLLHFRMAQFWIPKLWGWNFSIFYGTKFFEKNRLEKGYSTVGLVLFEIWEAQFHRFVKCLLIQQRNLKFLMPHRKWSFNKLTNSNFALHSGTDVH